MYVEGEELERLRAQHQLLMNSLTRQMRQAVKRTVHCRRTIAISTRLLAPQQGERVPWFVEKEAILSQSQHPPSPSSPSQFRNAKITPPPPSAPEPLLAIHETLSAVPVIDSVSISHSSTYLEALSTSDSFFSPGVLPTKRPQGKRGRKSSSFGGETGIDDPPFPWDWILSVTVKPGSEKKGSVNVVLEIIRKTVSTIYCILLRRRYNYSLVTDVARYRLPRSSRSFESDHEKREGKSRGRMGLPRYGQHGNSHP